MEQEKLATQQWAETAIDYGLLFQMDHPWGEIWAYGFDFFAVANPGSLRGCRGHILLFRLYIREKL